MARLFLLSFLLVVVAVESRQAVSPLEAYWLSVLPNTTMPNAIRNLIDVMKDSTVAKNRVKVRDGMGWCLLRYLPGELPSADYVQSTFFLMKNMYPGAQMNQGLDFDQTIIGGAFVPRAKADRINLSSENLPQILDHFSMVPGSKEAKQMEKILKDCEVQPLMGEKKFCSTSLEVMIDNVIALLGTTNIKALSTTIHRNNGRDQQGKTIYTIASPIKKIPYHSRLVICHQEPSPQAIHYCHTNHIAYGGFVIPLVGMDGSKVNAVAVCHHDKMNMHRFFFEALNVEPGAVEQICHFLPENHLIWVSSEAMSKAHVDIGSDCVS
ncbi:BURP domain-containing protein 6-like [Carex rostrata]